MIQIIFLQMLIIKSMGCHCNGQHLWLHSHSSCLTVVAELISYLPLFYILFISSAMGWNLSDQQQPTMEIPSANKIGRSSFFDPILKVKSHNGYLLDSSPGTFVRIAPSIHAPPLQILVDDKDLQPGMPSAIYQYILTGYGAEHFAVDQHGNLYLADSIVWDRSTDTKSEESMSSSVGTFALNVMAREMDTEPKRSSQTIVLTINLLENHRAAMSSFMATQTVYLANVSAWESGERVIAQVKAREGDGAGTVRYKIVEVSDQAFASFYYDEQTNELRAVGPLYPDHRYKVVIEAIDADGLVGHAVVLVQAMPPPNNNNRADFPTGVGVSHPQPYSLPVWPSAFLPVKPNPSPDTLALLPANLFPSGIWPTNNPIQATTATTTVFPPIVTAPSLMQMPLSNKIHTHVQNIFVEVPETSPTRTLIYTLGDNGTRGKIYFVLIRGNEDGKFLVDANTGNVVLNADLDREHTDKYKLEIEARSRAPFDQLLYLTNLIVFVMDTNDNAPQFRSPYPLMLSTRLEGLLTNTSDFTHPNILLGRILVEDPDQGANGHVRLQVMPPLDRLFTINDDGEVRINGMLSESHMGEHRLTVMAIDHGQPPQESRAVLSIRIDGQFMSSIRETMLASNGFNSLSQATTIVANAGEQQPFLSSTVTSNYEKNDENQWSNGSENTESGDADDQQQQEEKVANVEIEGANDGMHRRLQPSSKSSLPLFTRLQPKTDAEIDHLVIQSTSAQPSMLFPALPTPKHIPFPAFAATTAPQLPYTGLAPFNGFSLLTNHSQITPDINAINSVPPPYLPIQTATMAANNVAEASSSMEQFNTRLAPIFESAELKVFVEENEEQMQLITLKARYPDAGPGPITYVLQAGDSTLFNVDSTTGQVTLLKALDAESQQQPPIYRLKVGSAEAARSEEFITEPGLAHSCELIVHVVDINDWIPNFKQEHYEFKISPFAKQGAILGEVTAYDLDLTAPNNKIQYRILNAIQENNEKANASNFLQIDADSGRIILNGTGLSDFAGQNITFHVQAIDGDIDEPLNSTARVTVMVEAQQMMVPTVPTENPKIMEGNKKEVTDRQTIIERTTTTLATTSPATTTTTVATRIFLTTTNPNEDQSIKPFSFATIKTMSPVVSSMSPFIQLPSSMASNTIGNSIQFSSREFNATVMEGTRPPVLAKTLEVRNKLKDTRFTICAIVSGNFRSAFSVAANADGDCELRTEIQLDREFLAQYQLNISVESGGQTDWTLVNVIVLDVNDQKPKFIYPLIKNGTSTSSGETTTMATYFAVLPVETNANEKFFKLNAEDGDAPNTANSFVTFELDNQSTSGDAQYFGIETKTGELWPRKRARELMHLAKRDYFRLTAIACDNPGQARRRLCSRTSLMVQMLESRHRFVLLFAGTTPEQLKRQEIEIMNSLRPFIAPCSKSAIERIEQQSQNEISNKAANGQQQTIVNVRMYAMNLKERKLCLQQEIHKIFTTEAKEALMGSMRQWGAELLDVLRSTDEIGNTKHDADANRIDDVETAGGMAALFFPITLDWKNTSTVLISVAAVICLIALVGSCALFVFRARHRQDMRRRAEQMRRRHHQHRGNYNPNGLLAVNGTKCAGRCVEPMNGLFTSASGLPSSYAASSNISNNLYMPSATPLNSASVGPAFERNNKFYESQMLQLPISDGDDFIRKPPVNPILQRIMKNGMMPSCSYNNNIHGQQQHNRQNGDGENVHAIPSASNNSSPNERQYSSGLLPPPPPAESSERLQQSQMVKRRLTNSDNLALIALTSRTHCSPRNAGGINNPEGDFSIEESFYAANQARYLH